MHDDQTTGLDRRALLRRMAVGGAVAWTAPMFHSVASAQALPSACSASYQLNWDALAVNSLFTSTVVGGTTVSLAVTFTNTTPLTNNRRILAGPYGGQAGDHLRFEQDPNQNALQTIVFTFSQPIRALSFQIFDIDNLAGNWSDRIELVTPGLTGSTPPGSTVVLSGGLWQSSSASNNFPAGSILGNLNVTHAGPITSFQINYRNGPIFGGSNQLISFSDINWCR